MAEKNTGRAYLPEGTGGEPSGEAVAAHGAKILGEAVLAPGTSLLLDGKVIEGGAHVVGALLAKWAIGPIGWVLVAGNSYCKSVTGENLPKALFRWGKQATSQAKSRINEATA